MSPRMSKSVGYVRKSLQKVPLLQQEREAVETAVGTLKHAVPIEWVILFGAKAREDADVYSDVDLLLLTAGPLHWKEAKAIVETLSGAAGAEEKNEGRSRLRGTSDPLSGHPGHVELVRLGNAAHSGSISTY